MLQWMIQRQRLAGLVAACALGACSDPPGPCGAGPCSAGDLADSDYCPGGECARLEELSQGCLGSHTEQPCTLCGFEFIQIGGNDDADLYYDRNGRLAAVRRTSAASAACAGWYGADLSGCVATSEPVTVPCESSPE
jgi:hypothetical protein